MGALDGRVAIVTGGGRGVGREHALLLASEGAAVVVNDLGGNTDGTGSDQTAAESVAAEIVAAGGKAVANGDSVTSWEGAQRIVNTAVETFGDLHVVVANAGILRDRIITNMTEEEFDAVIDVHVKGTFCVARWAAAYWREQAKAGNVQDRSIVTTSSAAGLHGNPGQTNYSGAKSAILGMTQVMAMELGRYQVRANAIAPLARTRLILQTPGTEWMNPPEDPAVFDQWEPANISPVVAWLASAACPANGEVLGVHGGTVCRYQQWAVAETVTHDGRWTVAELQAAAGGWTKAPKVRTQLDVVFGK